ncbi:MAG: hypothetical protein JW384_02988 [Nitrosomonadaceae bacterium]|nr:hypothetical protein [Nitrosomonadaceae bacterium]
MISHGMAGIVPKVAARRRRKKSLHYVGYVQLEPILCLSMINCMVCVGVNTLSQKLTGLTPSYL